MYEKGLAGMRYSISNTAEYGDYTRGKRVITDETRASMRKILEEIQSGDFAREWIAENRAGQENFKRMRAEQADTRGRARRCASCARTWTGSSPRSRGRRPGVLAYVSWHRPAPDVDLDRLRAGARALPRSLARARPAGCAARPCSSSARSRGRAPRRHRRLDWRRPGYEDWYLLEDLAALGVLEEAAVSRGHVSAHDDAARRYRRWRPAGVYTLLEGGAQTSARSLRRWRRQRRVWVARRGGRGHRARRSCSATAWTPSTRPVAALPRARARA